MKRILSVLIIVACLLTVNVSAAKVGDKITKAVYTDIVAYINNYPMPCYVIDGYAVIVAEDLKDYCCDVYFESSTRTLSITRSAKTTFTPPAVYKPTRKTGEFYTDVLYTDIQTYVNNTWVKSFNANGKTMIVIDEFGKAMDGYEWDGANRAAKAWMVDKPKTEFKEVETLASVNNAVKIFQQYYDSCPFVDEFEGLYDVNFDGTYETIKVNVSYGPSGNIKVTVGNRSKSIIPIVSSPMLDKVYICDLNPYDGYMDLAVVTHEECPTLRIFKCDRNLSMYKNNYRYGGSEDCILLGFGYSSDLSISADGSFSFATIIGETLGKIFRTYKLNEKNVFTEVVPDYYVVDNSVMKNYIPQDVTGYESTMWEKGYLKAYYSYGNGDVAIKKGEYFQTLYYLSYYDEGNDEYVSKFFVQTESGDSGWIKLNESSYHVNAHYFNKYL